MKNVNKKLYNRKGFTLAEMLLTVSIIIILGAVIAVNVIRYRQNLKLTEMDNAAREIYMAAQNHLSESVSTGEWGQLYDSKVNSSSASGTGEETKTSEYFGTYRGSKVSNVDKFASSDNTASKSATSSSGTTETTSDSSSTSQTASAASTDTSATSGSASQNTTCNKTHAYYYLVVNSTSDLKNNALEQILPNGSIDETVRKGNYIIEYDAIQGQVYDVFYTDADVTLTYENSVSSLDSQITSDIKVKKSRSDSKSLRKQFTIDNKKIALGYYGSATATDDTYSDEKITVDVKNENRLYLIVNVPNSLIPSGYTLDTSGISISLKDLRLGASGVQGTVGRNPILTSTDNNGKQYVYILDSPVEDGYSIADSRNVSWTATSNSSLLNISSKDNDKFCIGDNLRANVTVTATKISNSKKKKTFKVTSKKFNSAFADGSTDKNAQITNGRHLQNLAIATDTSNSSTTGSGSTENSLATLGTDNNTSNEITTVKILNDITWYTTDQDKDDYFDYLNTEPISHNITAENLKTTITNITDHGFTGIQSSSIKSVTGSIKRDSGSTEPDMPILSGFSISDNSGYNGLFANMTSSSLSVKNLYLKDFNITNVNPDGQNTNTDWIKSQNGKTIYSGALLGNYKGKTLTVDQVSVDGITENFASKSGILAGGLIGNIDVRGGKANITDCFASVNSITGNSDSTDKNTIKITNIGGLIGSTESGSITTQRCYSSGRTINGGDYDETNTNLQVENGNVGGFIGNAKGAFTAKYSYSTCSVGANNGSINKTDGSAGGFIGFMSQLSSAHWCYSTGEIINLDNNIIATDDNDSNKMDFGQFIGQVNKDLNQDNITNCFVLSGINYDSMPTVWKDNSEASNIYTGILIKKNSDTGINPFNVETDHQGKATPVDTTLIKNYQTYPYCTTNQLVNLEKKGKIDSDQDSNGHFGDWPVIKDTPAQIGLIYYEKITSNQGKPEYYYDGYWETMSQNPSDYNITKMQNNVNPIPANPDGYVVEDGYALVLKVNQDRKNTIQGPNGTKLSANSIYLKTETGELFKLGDKNIVLGNNDNIGNNKDFNDYKLYVIPEPSEESDNKASFSKLYDSKKIEIYIDDDGDKKTSSKTQYASFKVNLYSANSICQDLNDTSQDNYIAVRSARQLYNLYWNANHEGQTSYLANINYTINQTVNIDFNQEFTRRKSGSSEVNYNFQSITKDVTFACNYNGNNMTINGLDTGSNNLFGGTNTGTLQNLTFTNVSGNSLFAENKGTINNVSIQNATMTGNGVADTNSGVITGTSIVNANISKSGFVETNTGTLVDDHIYSDSSVYSTIVNKNNNDNLKFRINGNVNESNLYDLITIGSNNVTSIGGFANSNSGNIFGCSVTGTIKASGQCSGFVVSSNRHAVNQNQTTNSIIQGNYANVVIQLSTKNNNQNRNTYATGFIGTVKDTALCDNMVTGVLLAQKKNNGHSIIMSGFAYKIDLTKNSDNTDSQVILTNNYCLVWCMNATKAKGNGNNKDVKARFCVEIQLEDGNANNLQMQNNGWLSTVNTLQYTDGINLGTDYGINNTSAETDKLSDIVSVMTATDSSNNSHFTKNSNTNNTIGVYLYNAFIRSSDLTGGSQIQTVVPFKWAYDYNTQTASSTETPQTWYGDYYIEGTAENNTNTLYGNDFGVSLSIPVSNAKSVAFFSEDSSDPSVNSTTNQAETTTTDQSTGTATDSSNSTSTNPDSESTPPISINLAYIYQLIVQKKGLMFFPKMKAFF